jgi:hypothetical protein
MHPWHKEVTCCAHLRYSSLHFCARPMIPSVLFFCAVQSGMDNVRNITGSPIAGIDPHELLDTRPLCHGERSKLQTATCVPCKQPRRLPHAALACSTPACLH